MKYRAILGLCLAGLLLAACSVGNSDETMGEPAIGNLEQTDSDRTEENATTDQNEPEVEIHVHTGIGDWQWSGTDHWQLCECGEEAGIEAHVLDEMSRCTVCGCEVWDYGESIDVYSYDENGKLKRTTNFDDEGNVNFDAWYEREYDEAGNLLKEAYFSDGRCHQEDRYIVTEEGENLLYQGYSFQEDGTYYLNEYDEDGNLVALYSYDVNDNLLYESHSEYALTAEGMVYEAKTIETVDGITYVYEYNEYGDLVLGLDCDVDGNVTRKREYLREYDIDGKKLWEKYYVDDILVHEITGYIEGSNGEMSWRVPETTMDYYEDGSYAKTEFSAENGEIAREVFYAPDGTMERQVVYTYEYDEEGNCSRLLVHENDRLLREVEYGLDSWGWSCITCLTEYREDGGWLVTKYADDGSYRELTYDANGQMVDDQSYDADGNEL